MINKIIILFFVLLNGIIFPQKNMEAINSMLDGIKYITQEETKELFANNKYSEIQKEDLPYAERHYKINNVGYLITYDLLPTYNLLFTSTEFYNKTFNSINNKWDRDQGEINKILKDRRELNYKEVQDIFRNYKYTEIKEPSFDEGEKHYEIENLGYLIIWDYSPDHSVLFDSKEVYLSCKEQEEDIVLESCFPLDLDDIYQNSETYINQLNKVLSLNLSINDRVINLKTLDEIFFEMNYLELEYYDFNSIKGSLFAYFSQVITNEVEADQYVVRDDENGTIFEIHSSKRNKSYEIYKDFDHMLFKKDENFSFYSLAGFLLSDFRLTIKK